MKTTKLKKEQIEELSKIKSNNEILLKELGLIKLQEIDLEARENRAIDFLTKMREAENNIAQSLEKEYGKGTVNLDTGEFNSID